MKETQPAEPEKKDNDVPLLPEPLQRKSKKLLTFCTILELLSIPLTLAAMHYVTLYVEKWWLAALLLCIPHVLVGSIILNRVSSFRKAYPEAAEACDFSVFLAFWLFVVIFTICLSYFYIHYPVNFLLKILISLGLNLLPTIVTFFMYTLGM